MLWTAVPAVNYHTAFWWKDIVTPFWKRVKFTITNHVLSLTLLHVHWFIWPVVEVFNCCELSFHRRLPLMNVACSAVGVVWKVCHGKQNRLDSYPAFCHLGGKQAEICEKGYITNIFSLLACFPTFRNVIQQIYQILTNLIMLCSTHLHTQIRN